MANDFDDVRLPVDIERGAVGGPNYNTTLIRLASGGEQRNQDWQYPLDAYNIGYGIQGRSDMEAVYAFFHARGGRARAFRFRNWLDYVVTEGLVGTIAGQPLRRQLIRVYSDAANTQTRIIVLPVASTLKVYKDAVLTTDYDLLPNGVLEFPSDPGVDVLASFEFDILCRFDTDRLNAILNTYREGVFPSIQLIELR